MIKLKKLYLATDKYDDSDVFYNIFFKIGNQMEYLSIDRKLEWIQYIDEDYDTFEEDILDNYEFEELNLTTNLARNFIKLLFTGMLID